MRYLQDLTLKRYNAQPDGDDGGDDDDSGLDSN